MPPAARFATAPPPASRGLASLAFSHLHPPHLTEQNLVEVLARAKHRTKREIKKLVRILDPLPAVPARIEPLGPAPARVVPSTPTWEELMHRRRVRFASFFFTTLLETMRRAGELVSARPTSVHTKDFSVFWLARKVSSGLRSM